MFIFLEMESHYVFQGGLELLTSSSPPASIFWSAEIAGVSHHAWPVLIIFQQASISPQGSAVSKGMMDEEGRDGPIHASPGSRTCVF